MDFDGINSVIFPNETIWPELDVKHNWADGLLRKATILSMTLLEYIS